MDVCISVFVCVSVHICVCRSRCVCVFCGCMRLDMYLWEYTCTYLSACGYQYPYRPLCMNRTYILSRRQAYQHTQDASRRSGLEPGGRSRRQTPTGACVGDSRTPRPARSPPIAGQLAAVGGVVESAQNGPLPLFFF